jgi:FtsZ-binding cell division protein ZapB
VLDPLIAERDALKEERDALKEERDALKEERDCLAVKVERLLNVHEFTAQSARVEIGKVTKARDVFDAAIQKIGMKLGSTDEWTDQATMIADVEERVENLLRENDRLTKEHADFAELVREYASNETPPFIGMMAEDRDHWFKLHERAKTRIKELESKLIYGFYADRFPSFEQGPQKSEIQELLTADQVNGMIDALKIKSETINALVNALQGYMSYSCPACGGDCSSANPPQIGCPTRAGYDALARVKKNKET